MIIHKKCHTFFRMVIQKYILGTYRNIYCGIHIRQRKIQDREGMDGHTQLTKHHPVAYQIGEASQHTQLRLNKGYEGEPDNSHNRIKRATPHVFRHERS